MTSEQTFFLQAPTPIMLLDDGLPLQTIHLSKVYYSDLHVVYGNVLQHLVLFPTSVSKSLTEDSQNILDCGSQTFVTFNAGKTLASQISTIIVYITIIYSIMCVYIFRMTSNGISTFP